MLKKNMRIRKINLNEVFNFAEKYKNENFTILRLSNKNEKKFGVFLNTKDFKKAVIRNRIKRLIYEIIRRNIEKIPEGLFIIFPKQNCLKLNFKQLEKSILDIFINKISTDSR
jgi:ribonuclease P protein component